MPALAVSDVVVEGSPLLSLDLIITYFVLFLIASVAIYIIQHKIRKPQNPNHLKHFFIVSLLVKLGIIATGLTLAAFYFLPAPKVAKVSPAINSNNVPVTSKVEIHFDRPVSRVDLEKRISPSIPGVWRFEVGFYKTHFYRKLVFYPDVTLLPEVEYTIELKNIKNVSKLAGGDNYHFSFKTEPLPKVVGMSPKSEELDVDLIKPLEIKLDKPNFDIADFKFTIEPQVAFSLTKAKDQKSYFINPKEKLKQGTKYKLTIAKSRVTKNKSGEIVFVGSQTQEANSTFTTKFPASVASFSPSGEQAFVNSQIAIAFTKNVDINQIAKSISINPHIEATLRKKDEKTLIIIPKKLDFNTAYKVSVPKGINSPDGTKTQEDINLEFKTIGPVQLLSTISSTQNNLSIGVKNNIKFTFNQDVEKNSAQEHFSITPNTEGNFSWEDKTLIFTPKNDLSYDTRYQISFEPGIQSVNGQSSQEKFSTSFTTESYVFKLNVPAFLQKYTLSCEAATLRMILAYRGISETEDSILNAIGFDPTPRQGNTWGDPHAAFVGNVKGRQMITGYGVYWEPIERVAKKYREAKAFTNGDIKSLTSELKKGHPVQVWTFSKGGVPTSWDTLSGKKVHAVSGEHSIVVKGYVGRVEDPKQIIVNDPLVGEIYLTQGEFSAKWNSFSRSGVVVF